jgi:hypothetical protein
LPRNVEIRLALLRGETIGFVSRRRRMARSSAIGGKCAAGEADRNNRDRDRSQHFSRHVGSNVGSVSLAHQMTYGPGRPIARGITILLRGGGLIGVEAVVGIAAFAAPHRGDGVGDLEQQPGQRCLDDAMVQMNRTELDRFVELGHGQLLLSSGRIEVRREMVEEIKVRRMRACRSRARPAGDRAPSASRRRRRRCGAGSAS